MLPVGTTLIWWQNQHCAISFIPIDGHVRATVASQGRAQACTVLAWHPLHLHHLPISIPPHRLSHSFSSPLLFFSTFTTYFLCTFSLHDWHLRVVPIRVPKHHLRAASIRLMTRTTGNSVGVK